MDTPTSSTVTRQQRRFVSDGETAITFDSQPGMRGSVGLGQDSTATSPPRSRSPQTLPSRRPEYPRNAEHAAIDLTSNAVRFGRCTSRIPKDPVGARSLNARDRWKRPTPLWTLGALGMLPRPQRTSMPAAERRRPGVAGSRFLRAEARSRRSPAPPGGFDVNADAIPALCSCRLDTTDQPHGIGLGGVATTVPAETTRKTLGMR